MKILYVSRLFSGLERSVAEKSWIPTGVPTIYRLVEALSRQTELHLLLCVKDGYTSLQLHNDIDMKFEGLDCNVEVLASTPVLPVPLHRFSRHFREIRHSWKILRKAQLIKPDLIYIDHSNVWAAGLLARFWDTPVVFRVMGVYPAMRESLKGRRVSQRYLRWCYKSPFDAVICTQDGSGVEPWLEKALRPEVSVHTMINGVDHPQKPASNHPAIEAIPRTSIVVMFLGKLEDSKGALLFAHGFLHAQKEYAELHALIVGAGSQRSEIIELFKRAGRLANLTLIERLPHLEVLAAISRADIYVSLNRFGNLSNANLEAMRIGVAMVFPASQENTRVDVVTDKLLPSDAVWRIKSSDDHQGLVRALVSLANDPLLRKKMADRIQNFSLKEIGDWQARIHAELNILQEIIGKINRSP